jgi:hypothetical protein
LGACTVRGSKQEKSPQASPVSQQSNAAFLLSENILKKVNVSTGVEIYSSNIPSEYLPISFSYNDTFKVNSTQSIVVWFVPGKGLVRFSESDKSIAPFYVPSDWFYENPYFQFLGTTNTLILIDKKGSEVVHYNFDSNKSTALSVPYPFGTQFRVSPDLAKILYVEGYQQSVGKPSYLITTINGEPITQFDTEGEIAKRSLIEWNYDSKGILTLEKNSTIVLYPLEQAAVSSVLFTTSDGESIVSFVVRDSNLFVSTTSYMYLYSLSDQKLIKRLPMEMFSILRNPKYSLFDNQTILVEEDVTSFNETYKRLWKSDWIGNRQMVSPAYGRRVATSSL